MALNKDPRFRKGFVGDSPGCFLLLVEDVCGNLSPGCLSSMDTLVCAGDPPP